MGGKASKERKPASTTAAGKKGAHRTGGGAVSEHDRAILALKTQRRKLEGQQRAALLRSEDAFDSAKALVKAGQRREAKAALARKRGYEGTADALLTMLHRLEETLHEMETAARTQEFVTTMAEGGAALRRAQSEIPLEEVERIMAEVEDANEAQARINDLLGMEAPEGMTEEELEGEFADLADELGMREEGEGKKKGEEDREGVVALPDVPTHEVEREEEAVEAQFESKQKKAEAVLA